MSQSAFATYLVDDHGLLALKALSPPEQLAGEEVRGVRRSLVFDWTLVSLQLLAVCRHAASLYEKSGYAGPVQIGVELRLDERAYPLALELGRSQLGRLRGAAHYWRNDVERFEGGAPMMSFQRTVSEVRHCLAHQVDKVARGLAAESRWMHAFNVRSDDMSPLVAQISDALGTDAIP